MDDFLMFMPTGSNRDTSHNKQQRTLTTSVAWHPLDFGAPGSRLPYSPLAPLVVAIAKQDRLKVYSSRDYNRFSVDKRAESNQTWQSSDTKALSTKVLLMKAIGFQYATY
uniref:Uncharacterized protein n=1 Tax=Timema bartmani TaxID=61472 RepID=A0A7R9I2J2_9NEOP|nr:unnamed protein product [Timema bartmani]